MNRFLVAVALCTASAALADAPLKRRFAVVAGSNEGGNRPALRHAVSDARTFATVIHVLGGVAPDDLTLLEDPEQDELVSQLADMGERIRAVRGPAGGSIELVFYYSGHSDEVGLQLKDGRLEYAELRRALEATGADFRVAILDSCASGSFTRLKGGRRVPPFLSDASSQVQGEAVITSSSASEASQESDRLKGSFFTHHLVTGLRGAADVSRDGKVTLAEAYQFAFDETLSRTERTRAGAQHPAYEMTVAGTGDVVLTDLRGATALLSLPAESSGRYFLRDREGRLVAEVSKRGGLPMDLGLDDGTYEVTVARGDDATFAATTVTLRSGTSVSLDETTLKPLAPAESNRVRGDLEQAPETAPPKTWRAGAQFGVPIGFQAGAAYPAVDYRLRASFYFQPLVDDAETPFDLLELVQHPNQVAAQLDTGMVFDATGAATATTRVTLSGELYPWPKVGLGAGATVDFGGSAAVNVGARMYIVPWLRLTAGGELTFGARSSYNVSSTRLGVSADAFLPYGLVARLAGGFTQGSLLVAQPDGSVAPSLDQTVVHVAGGASWYPTRRIGVGVDLAFDRGLQSLDSVFEPAVRVSFTPFDRWTVSASYRARLNATNPGPVVHAFEAGMGFRF